jgi:hypothetical protein
MDKQQEPLKQAPLLWPTGVPNGVDEALRSIRSGRQARQVQQRIGHEDQTPMFPMASVLRMRYALKPRCPLLS